MERASNAQLPRFHAHPTQMNDLLRCLQAIPDTLRLQADVRAAVDSKDPDGCNKSPTVPRDWVTRVAEKLGNDASRALPWDWREQLKNFGRLDRMGIGSVEHMRAPLREFVKFRVGAIEADPAKEAERALVGSTVGIDFFPTPPQLSARMVAMAAVQAGMRVLEPSAGNGNIAQANLAAGAQPDVALDAVRVRRERVVRASRAVDALAQVVDHFEFQAPEPVVVRGDAVQGARYVAAALLGKLQEAAQRGQDGAQLELVQIYGHGHASFRLMAKVQPPEPEGSWWLREMRPARVAGSVQTAEASSVAWLVS